MGMDVLYEAEMPDLIGGLLRICLEAWVTGMWVRAVGDETLDILNAHYVFRNNLIIENAELGLHRLSTRWTARSTSRMSRSGFRRWRTTSSLMVTQTSVKWSSGPTGWSMRRSSNEAIHAGYASVLGHTVERPQWWGIRQSRYESGDGAGKILWAATLLAMLARPRVPGVRYRDRRLGRDSCADPAAHAVYLNDNPPEGAPTPL